MIYLHYTCTHTQSREVYVCTTRGERLNFAIHSKWLGQRNTHNVIIYLLLPSTCVPRMTEWEFMPAIQWLKLQKIFFFFGENSQKCHFTCHKPSFLGFPSHSQVCLIQTDSTALLRARCEHRSAVQPWPIFAPWCLIFHSCKTGIGILITFKNFNEYYCTRALILAKSWPCFRIQCCSSKTSTDGGEAPASLPLWVVLGCY